MNIRNIASALAVVIAVSAPAAVPAPASGAGGGMTWSLSPMAATTVATTDGSVLLTQSAFNAVDMAVAGISAANTPSDLSVSRRGGEIVVSASSAARWTIYSILGTVGAEGVVNDGVAVVTLDGMAPAMYILTIADARGGSQTMKIVVE